MKAQRTPATPHRFFHTMVVMGGGIAAAHCGGSTEGDPLDRSDDATEGVGGLHGVGGSTTEGSGGAATQEPASGGSTFGGGGDLMIPDTIYGEVPDTLLGGFGGQGAANDCPPAQWECGDGFTCSRWLLAFDEQKAASCSCNPDRPTSASDCANDETFVCQGFDRNGADEALEQAIPFSCDCVPSEISCNDECQAYYGDEQFADGYNCEEQESTILCGCGWVLLR